MTIMTIIFYGILAILACIFNILIFFKIKNINNILIKINSYSDESISDNGFNNDYIQSALNIINDKGYDCDIVPDQYGHRWIAIRSSDGKDFLNIIRIDDENFGANANWKNTESKLNNILNSDHIKNFLQKFEEK